MTLIPSMDLIDKEDRLSAVHVAISFGLIDSFTYISYPRKYRIEGYKMTLGCVGNDTSEGCFASSRWTRKNNGTKLVFLDGPA